MQIYYIQIKYWTVELGLRLQWGAAHPLGDRSMRDTGLRQLLNQFPYQVFRIRQPVPHIRTCTLTHTRATTELWSMITCFRVISTHYYLDQPSHDEVNSWSWWLTHRSWQAPPLLPEPLRTPSSFRISMNDRRVRYGTSVFVFQVVSVRQMKSSHWGNEVKYQVMKSGMIIGTRRPNNSSTHHHTHVLGDQWSLWR
jgi:hypothetical protein